MQGRTAGAQLLDDARAPKQRHKHDGGHPHTIVGIDVGAVREEQVHDFRGQRGLTFLFSSGDTPLAGTGC